MYNKLTEDNSQVGTLCVFRRGGRFDAAFAVVVLHEKDYMTVKFLSNGTDYKINYETLNHSHWYVLDG
jgi:hypothetical protein